MPNVLITGANRGIGLEFVKQFSTTHDVIATTRSPGSAAELLETGVRVEALDVQSESSIRDFAARIAGESIDLLINNAGVFPDKDAGLTDITQEQFDSAFRVNAVGPLLVTRALLANLRRSESPLVVNISSQMGSCGLARASKAGGHFAYRASKSALNMITALMAGNLSGDGFRVVGIHPGWVQTEMGGPQAPVPVKDSVASMIQAIQGFGPADSGRFFDESGKALPD